MSASVRFAIGLLLATAAAALVASCCWAYEHWRAAVFREGHVAGAALVQGEWDEERAQLQAQALENARQAAAETLRRLNAQQENQRAQDDLLARARADRDRAVAAVDGLRLRAASYLDAAGCGSLAGDPAVACVSQAAAALADALGRAGDLARRAASDADDARIRGLACEADYDALTLRISGLPQAARSPQIESRPGYD